MPVLRRFRERLVLGHVRQHLSDDEVIEAWSHANVPGTRAPGLLVVTDRRCLLHVASSTIPDTSTPLAELTGFKLDRRNPENVRVMLCGDDDRELMVELSLTSRARSRSVGRVLSALIRRQVRAPKDFDPALTSPLPPMDRNVRHHARRVWVTVLGVVVLLLSAVFASPFVPGPGALTAVAGIAILAREYEWARDLHVWAHRQAERFISWMRERLSRRRQEAWTDSDPTPGRAVAGAGVLEATVPAPDVEGDEDQHGALAC